MPWDEWVLNLFEQYRIDKAALNALAAQVNPLVEKNEQLEHQLEEAGTARIRLEDEIRTLEQRNIELKEETAAARRETIETHRKFTDHLAIVAHRRPVFDAAAPEMPASTERPINPTGKVYASEMAQRMTQLAIERDTEVQALRRRLHEQEIEIEKSRGTGAAPPIPANIQQQMEEDILTGV